MWGFCRIRSVMLHDPIPTHEALLDAGMVSHKIPPAFSIPCHPIYMNVFASSKLRSSRIQTSREGTTLLLCTAMGNLFVQGRRRSGRELQNPCPSMVSSPAFITRVEEDLDDTERCNFWRKISFSHLPRFWSADGMFGFLSSLIET
jgi:hypothetical protein